MKIAARKNNLIKKISITKIEKSCKIVSELLNSLSHPQRLMIMGHLTVGEKTVSELHNLCKLSQSHLSQSLSRMKSDGLIQSERRGKFQYYSIADHRMVKLIGVIQNLFCH